MKMPFGKHKGQEVAAIPPEYLRWAVDTCDLDGAIYSEMLAALGVANDPPAAHLERRIPALRSALLKVVSEWRERELWRNSMHHGSDADVKVIVGEVASAVTHAIDEAAKSGLGMVGTVRDAEPSDVIPLAKTGG